MSNNNNKYSLYYINDAVEENNELLVNCKRKNVLINPKQIEVIKRDGRIEPYSVEKMRKVCLWASDMNQSYADALLNATEIKLYNRIKIADVYDEIIKSAVNKISRLYPIYEKIAAKLYLLKYYREAWNIKNELNYIHLKKVIEKGIEHHRYNKEIFKSYTEEEIEELNKAIVPQNDFIFT
ncbi:MAG: hypothetical protein K2H80_00435, partial [Ureaplasma sp.]|nr:hypothetical protein [Ureaplasma sp.]